MTHTLHFLVDGVKVCDTDLSQYRTETALRGWYTRALRTYEELSGKPAHEAWTETYEVSNTLSAMRWPFIEKIRAAAEERKASMPPRNLDLVVVAQDEGSRDKSMNYGFKNQTAREVGQLLEMFDRAEQMTSYEFDAYATLGDEECDRQLIETLHDMFGTEWAEAFYKRKNSLIVRAQLEHLYEERRMLTAQIERLEATV